ncbi:MAG: hypothetical protein ACRD5H_04845 [Nitrososphaerales archaeon]
MSWNLQANGHFTEGGEQKERDLVDRLNEFFGELGVGGLDENIHVQFIGSFHSQMFLNAETRELE